MQDYKDFTVDQNNFKNFGEYLTNLKKDKNIKFIPIVNAGIAQRIASVDNYKTYTTGVDSKVFINSGASNYY